MQKHVRIYLKHHNYGEQDHITCEIPDCYKTAVDIHHIIFKSQQGKDEIDNLIGLCRQHHEDAHKKLITAAELQEVIKQNL